MNPTPYLTFQGTCKEAMETYAEIFGAEIDMMMKASEMPGIEVPEGKTDWIGHSGLKFADGMLMGSDDIFGGTPPMGGCSVMVTLPTTERGLEVFEKLSEGAEVRMPYQQTFWTPGFGTLTDRFGINWMISTDEPLPEG